MINSRYDLPKVKLRFKTDPSNSIINSAQITQFQKFDANPSVFLDRLKNGKQIHQAYMRYRKLKKHNYIKYPSNRKKNHSLAQCQRMNTMVLKRQCKRSLNKLNIALQTTFLRKNLLEESDTRKNRFNQLAIFRNGIRGQQYQRMQDLLIDLKPQTVSLKITKNMRNQPSLYQSAKNQLEFQEANLQSKIEDQKKYRINRLLKNKYESKLIRQANIFKIDPWNQDKKSINLHKQDQYHYYNDEF